MIIRKRKGLADDPWDLTERPHTKVKLRLLGDYFARWLTIWNGPKQRVWASRDWYIIDLFAGQGRYTDGDAKVSGSPLVYLERINGVFPHLKKNGIRIHILLVEKKAKNFKMLKMNISEFMSTYPEVKETVDIKFIRGDCNSDKVWGKISEVPLSQKTPLFLFVDPYGLAIQRQTMDRLVALTAAKDIFFNYMISGVKRARGIVLKPEETMTQRELTTRTTYMRFLGQGCRLRRGRGESTRVR